ncbi:PLC-like phosphodiesterase [Mortierella sp. GBAus27b]|nr:hypothetical protein BGX31_008270 [Mortierella sp. GBA43]KAI8360306.1 PLC-like phosphodiesterase [Mortierella sp. GBAus27b]
MRASLILSVGTLVLSTLVARSDAQKQVCNGYAELCSKPYDKVAYPTTHNSYAFNPPGGLATNQHNDIPTQLKDGIRAFMLDGYASSGNPNEIQLCHTACALLDAGPASKTLGQIKSFLDANPNEVVTIIWENAGLKPALYKTVYAAAGVEKYSYAPVTGNATWPTLSQMISSGKRLVSFLDTGADASVPYLMPEFSYVFETPYSIPKDSAYPCTIDRPKNQRRSLYVLNHFVYGAFGSGDQKIEIPQPGAADKTNGADLTAHVKDCQATLKQMPNFVTVDFYDKGVLLQTVANVNGVQWNGQLPTPSKGNNSTGSSSGSGSGSGSGSPFGFLFGGGAASLKSQMASQSTLGALAVAVMAVIGMMA